MNSLKKILNCREKWRCNRSLSCSYCGSSWQRGKFKGFIQSLNTLHQEQNQKDISLTYIVIRSNNLGSLKEKLHNISTLTEKLKELKKRGKLGVFFGRLEVSFSKVNLGFNPHLNLLVWGDVSPFKKVSHELNLNFWSQNKTNDKDTALSIAWYMLKFNNIGIEKGEAVRKALNRKRTILNSTEFNFKSINYIDEYIDIDFSFLVVKPIRSKKEILLRSEHKKTLQELRRKLKAEIAQANKELWH